MDMTEQPAVAADLLTATNTISLYSQVYIQNFTNHAWVCNSMLKNMYKWAYAYSLQFNGPLDYMTSLFTGLLAKSLTFSTVISTI